MPEVLETNAATFLMVGALGIAEEHETPAARELVLRLMEMGVVRKFFVELPKNVERFATALAKAQTAAQSGASIEDITQLAPSGNLDPGNRLSIGYLIAIALSKNIEVYLADDRDMLRQNGGSFQKRHASIRETFKAATGQAEAKWYTDAAKGCLLLWGGAHFDDKFKNTALLDQPGVINGLPYVKKG
jgi:hypothetical protein